MGLSASFFGDRFNITGRDLERYLNEALSRGERLASEGERRVGVALVAGIHSRLQLGCGHQAVGAGSVGVERIVIEEAVPTQAGDDDVVVTEIADSAPPRQRAKTDLDDDGPSRPQLPPYVIQRPAGKPSTVVEAETPRVASAVAFPPTVTSICCLKGAKLPLVIVNSYRPGCNPVMV